MRKKTSLTIVERAMVLVPEFKDIALKLEHRFCNTTMTNKPGFYKLH